MLAAHRQLILDESNQPMAVVIPYKEWLEVEKCLLFGNEHGVDLNDLAGTLKAGEDALEIQRRLREEWP